MHPVMPRPFLFILLLPLVTACQTPRPSQSTAGSADATTMPTPRSSFNQDTVQTYDIETNEFQQGPPFGARSDRSQ